ncbi:hypothetical protein AG1IA_02762 [Rhizoctonia solani AG-1 IA]|uniref:Uncharacterized protein n=1 Tax=Thanatephorus cucumeris (strain AG1-IA) TaxID=983506 RepID=L8WZ12_THACA|nr:hypothetical protein AG1IA_02762 [Rhizoctonia solani AG-1 IA]
MQRGTYKYKDRIDTTNIPILMRGDAEARQRRVYKWKARVKSRASESSYAQYNKTTCNAEIVREKK